MRIACLTPLYPPSFGGTQILTRQCARHFSSQGHRTAVFTSAAVHLDQFHWKKAAKARLTASIVEEGAVTVHRFSYGGVPAALAGFAYAAALRTGYPPLWHPFFSGFQDAFYHEAEMRRAALEFRPDVLFVNPFTEYQTNLAEKLKRDHGIPVAYHLSLHVERHLFPRKELMRLAAFDAVMTNTEFEKEHLANTGVDPARIHVTGATFDVGEFLKPEPPEPFVVEKLEGKKFLLYFGRREPGKGVDTLIEAFEKVSADYPDAYLVVAGRSTEHFDRHWRDRALRHPGIVLWEALSEGSKKWLYRHALAYAMVSNIDSFGLVYFEAWFSGCAVIGADVGAIKNVITNGSDGRLVPYGDSRALASALRDFLENPEAARRLGASGRQKAQRLLGEQAVEKKMLDILCRIAEKGSSKH